MAAGGAAAGTASPGGDASAGVPGTAAAAGARTLTTASAGLGLSIIVPVMGMKNTPTSRRECTLPSSSLV